MPAPTLTNAPEVKAIANELIPAHHNHLLSHRVRMEYVFSDQEIETGGKARWGEARKITNLQAFLAGDPEEQPFEELTFVCTLCHRWCTEEEFNQITAGDDTYSLCKMCEGDVTTWDLRSNKAIAKLTEKAISAWAKQSAGPPENPGFFAITIYKSYWDRMRPETKRAVVDHELCHCGAAYDKNGDVKVFIIPHDVEEFVGVVKRNGYTWRGDVRNIAAAIKQHDQLSLGMNDIPDPEAADEAAVERALRPSSQAAMPANA